MALPDPTAITGPVGTRLTIPTPYEGDDGQTTHPSIVHLDAPVSGFRYWMAHTPYLDGDDEYENPCVLASNDGVVWVVPPGLVNPLDEQPGSPGAYNSDVDLRYVDGIFHLVWRTYDPANTGAEEQLYFSTSADGVAWETKTQFYTSDETVRRLVSPCVLFEDGAWAMWAVDIVPSPNQVVRVQGGAALSDAWADPVGVDMGPMQSGKEPWHLGIIQTDDGYVGLLADCTQDISGTNGDLLFVASADGLTWINSGTTVIPRVQPGEHNQLYRATLLPDVQGGVAGWRVWYAGWLSGSPQVWHLYRTFIAAPAPAPSVPVAPPPVTQARIEIGVEWCAVDDRTGRRIADLPDVKGGSNTGRLLMAYTSQKITIPLASLPIAVIEQATEPQQTSIVQVVNGLPVWSGRVLIQEGGSGPDLTLATASPEQYLLQRRVTTRSYTDTDRAEVAVELLSDAGSTDLGSGMDLEIDAELCGDLVDRRYLASDQTTVYSALRELAEAGTLEWTIDLGWADTSETRIRRIMRLRNRVGQRASRPPVFETDTSYTLKRDFSTGRYANHVTVYGDGEGVDMPRSDPAVDTAALAAGAPIVEAVLHVRDAMTPAERNALAQAELVRLMHGVELWDLDCPLNSYPRLGYDIGLGDWGAWDLEGPRHPDGVTGSGRVIGWDLDAHAARWQPKLLDPHEEVAL